jgi:putative sigma-54 modulation protein
MQIQITSVHFTANAELENFVNQKVKKLSTFFDGIERAEVFLKLNNDSQNREHRIAEVKLLVPGQTLFASEQAKTFEEATAEAVEAVRNQLLTYKGKLTAKH